jgi:hypothetical protein
MGNVENRFQYEQPVSPEERKPAFLCALQQVGVLDAEGNPNKGKWGKHVSEYMLEDDISIFMRGDELFLVGNIYKVFGGTYPFESESFSPKRGPEEFKVFITNFRESKAGKQKIHRTRVFGNES